VIAGQPVVLGTRPTVEFILNLLAHGATTEDILKEYEGLTVQDVQDVQDVQTCLLFATKSMEDTAFMP
jgi:uncharacterized protein (DUF433 family)